MKQSKKGFSLIELMIVISIVAILLAMAYPSYVSFVRKSHRAEAVVTLLDWANRQDMWRADNPSYSNDITPASTDHYVYSIVSTAVSYTLSAAAQGSQVKDKEHGVACTTMTLNQAGIPGPTDYEECWNR